MRESGHFDSLFTAFRKRDSENLGCHYGVFAIRFIEVATAKQQHCVRILVLKREELLHHRGLPHVFICHDRFFLSTQRHASCYPSTWFVVINMPVPFAVKTSIRLQKRSIPAFSSAVRPWLFPVRDTAKQSRV